ncbi:hypothetical protein PV327_000749 [Microctonus hyperodae]|uniref:Chitin-binding type-2 domain-containing protein n=1 Tax=Microctonus hyperodae TaxID=165561 RepID=A0AA39L296_MICHY|nr:hypothetical protein PV327_000749 [Microctonus hyperodae]
MRDIFLSNAASTAGTFAKCERNVQRTTRASRNDASVNFECPEEFGYYPHPHDCTQYYVCVFGGALLESCTGGLMYSHELQTCDWPRNVGCQSDAGSIQEAEEDDPLLERSSVKAETQRQQQHHQQRQPAQRQHIHVTSPSPSITQITERQSRPRQQHQQQHSHSTYQDDDLDIEKRIELVFLYLVNCSQGNVFGFDELIVLVENYYESNWICFNYDLNRGNMEKVKLLEHLDMSGNQQPSDINDEYSGKISRETIIFVVLINGNDKSHIRHSDTE